jgi:dTDP-4-dehydrorhamnose reductase
MRGENISIVADVWENPLYNISCGHALWAAIRKRPEGIIHLAGKDSINRYQFAKEVARTFDLDATLIKKVSSKAFPDIAPRPRNTTFLTTRMETELGVRPMSLREGLAAMKAAMSARA